MSFLRDLHKKAQKLGEFSLRPREAEKYIEDKKGKDIFPGLYKPKENTPKADFGSPPALTNLNDPKVRQARVDAIRQMLSRRGRKKTMMSDFGEFGSATSGRKTLLGS